MVFKVGSTTVKSVMLFIVILFIIFSLGKWLQGCALSQLHGSTQFDTNLIYLPLGVNECGNMCEYGALSSTGFHSRVYSSHMTRFMGQAILRILKCILMLFHVQQ